MNGDGGASPSLLIQLDTVMETKNGKEDVVKRIIVDAEDTFEDTIKAISEKVVRSYHAPLNGILLSWEGNAVRIYGWKHNGVMKDIGSVREGLL